MQDSDDKLTVALESIAAAVREHTEKTVDEKLSKMALQNILFYCLDV
jgi:hypothetical protein